MILKTPCPCTDVPAHTGGVDLRNFQKESCWKQVCPRPHGRGGFKVFKEIVIISIHCPRPHGRGGFKEPYFPEMGRQQGVPAHTGGVDLRFAVAI